MKKILFLFLLAFSLHGGLMAQQKPAPKKADGTPDMRYKANKEAATKAATGPKKADGTPDMRYKQNKDALKPVPKVIPKTGTSSSTPAPKKKN